MSNTNAVTNIPQETINSVLVDILKGAKDAGHEIYGASKVGIVKAVDFAQEQAPLVVQEFLKWKFAEATIAVIMCIVAFVVMGFFIRKCFTNPWPNKSDGFSIMGGVILSFIVFMMATKIFIPNVNQMVKVKVAPRVYIIEWVSDQVTDKMTDNHR